MNKIAHIQVSLWGRVLYSREIATTLITTAAREAAAEIYLSFAGVEFVSRSFADQFYKEQQQLQGLKKIVIENSTPGVSTMLQTAAKTQQTSRLQQIIPAQAITSKKGQLEFFMAM
jgi:anti-anti-sigma regulatory factor